MATTFATEIMRCAAPPGRSGPGCGRAAHTFDFADIANSEGAPSFAHFAKGGYHKRLHLRGHAARSGNEIFVHPSFTLTGPASSKR